MKRGIVIGVVVVVIIAIALGIYFYSSGKESTPTPISSDCIGEDESVDILLEENWHKDCCEGLTQSNVCSSDVSIGNKCYKPPTDAIPIGCIYHGCSNCGDGSCKDNEDICSCPKDCVGIKENDYETIQDFCDQSYDQYCKDIPEGEKTDLCRLCE